MCHLSKYFQVLNKRKKLIILLSIVYLIGLIFGFLLLLGCEKLFFFKNTVNFFVSAFSKNGSVSSIIINRIFVDLFCLLIIFITQVNIYLFALNFFIIIYRGYIIGAIGITLINSFGITGIIVYLLTVLLQSIISTLGLILFSTIIYDYLKLKCCKKQGATIVVESLILVTVVILLSVLIEFLMIVLFLKPMNFCF